MRIKNALDVVSSVALIVVCGAFLWTLFFKDSPAARAGGAPMEAVEGLRLDAANITNVIGTGRVAIVEFSDFQCPFCIKHANEVLPRLKEALIATGDVRYVALHFPIEEIHPAALKAGEAAECGGKQNRFWEMREKLFAHPGRLGPDDFLNYANVLSLDEGAFLECLEGHQTLEKVRQDREEGRRLGVTGTPAFFIGTLEPDGGIRLVKRIRGTVSADVLIAQVAKSVS
ncbi:MAG TPA: DsbA family protein [Vicinamibacterales bacterium]|nr:DsbA family protein [Vicinamibacterales bacterium]